MGMFDPAKLVVEGWNGYVREKRKSENLLAISLMINRSAPIHDKFTNNSS